MMCAARWPACLVIMALAGVAACGGGGGGGGSDAPGPAPGSTRFVGNLRQDASTESGTIAGAAAVQVCVEGTTFCTEVDEHGVFTLAADVGGDIVLIFDGPDFSARLPLNDVPSGATVRIEEIECSTITGQCRAESVDIVTGPNSAPLCAAAVAQPAALWPPNHQMVGVAIEGIVDPDGDPVVLRVTEVASDEAVDAPGSGNTAPDVQLDPLAVRAERSGQGDGRIYTIAFVADDHRGGTCRGVVTVCVPHDQGQGSACTGRRPR